MSDKASTRHRVRWCFHTTAMVADYELTLGALSRIVGCRALEDHVLDDPAIGRRGGMAWVGDNSIEIGEPSVAGGAVDRYVKKFGSHMSSIAVQVADTGATIAHLESVGVRVSSRIDDDIVFTSPSSTAGIAIEWFGGVPANDPRFGTEIPTYPVPPLLDVTQMAFGGAVVTDPVADAHHLAKAFGTSVTFVDDDAAPGWPRAGVSLGDMTLALFAMPEADESDRLWGHTYTRPQTSSLGVRVPDLSVALDALREDNVRLVRHDDRMIVIHPSATGGVSIVVLDQLLERDPRAVGMSQETLR